MKLIREHKSLENVLQNIDKKVGHYSQWAKSPNKQSEGVRFG